EVEARALQRVAVARGGDLTAVRGLDGELEGVQALEGALGDGQLGGQHQVVAVLAVLHGAAVPAVHQLAAGHVGHVHGDGAGAVQPHDVDRLGRRVDGGQVGR